MVRYDNDALAEGQHREGTALPQADLTDVRERAHFLGRVQLTRR